MLRKKFSAEAWDKFVEIIDTVVAMPISSRPSRTSLIPFIKEKTGVDVKRTTLSAYITAREQEVEEQQAKRKPTKSRQRGERAAV